jgi:hypothetical protein
MNNKALRKLEPFALHKHLPGGANLFGLRRHLQGDGNLFWFAQTSTSRREHFWFAQKKHYTGCANLLMSRKHFYLLKYPYIMIMCYIIINKM